MCERPSVVKAEVVASFGFVAVLNTHTTDVALAPLFARICPGLNKTLQQ
jgi:hypothetical protein